MRIGVIGTGTIASAVVEGIASDGHQIVVSKRTATNAARLASQYDCVSVAGNQAVLDQSDIVFLGLMASAAPGILDGLTFRPDHMVISLMAGATLDKIASLVAPARAKAVMIPFPGIAQGGSPVMVRGEPEIVQALFGDRNAIFVLSTDAELAAYMSAQAVLSPAVQMVSDAATWLGARVEDQTQAEEFLRLLVGSSLLSSECAPLLSALDTPGGYNQRLHRYMIEKGTSKTLCGGLDRLEAGK